MESIGIIPVDLSKKANWLGGGYSISIGSHSFRDEIVFVLFQKLMIDKCFLDTIEGVILLSHLFY